MKRLLSTALAALALSACSTVSREVPAAAPPAAPAVAPARSDNPLLRTWTGPYGGVPPFGQVRLEHFRPGLDAALQRAREEVARIADNPEPPTFENTMARMEASGRLLQGDRAIYGVFTSTLSSPEFQVVEREMAPKLQALSDEVTQNEKLFRRVEAVYKTRETSGLTPEQQRLVWRQYTEMVREGAQLGPDAKKQLTDINQRLAVLHAQFNQNVLGDEEGDVLYLATEADLAGLPESVRGGAKAAAEALGHPGQWAITNIRSSVEPFLTYSPRRDLREKVWRSFVSRGDHPGPRDNKPLITEILALRAERARLLGYATYAHWRLENAMAKTPERAMQLMQAVWPVAVGRVREEVSAMTAIAKKEGMKGEIEPWDYRYYQEKVRKATY
ncbi:MAG TPA: M3 family metallopeptidase, partial [Myxococcaceae bacterium]